MSEMTSMTRALRMPAALTVLLAVAPGCKKPDPLSPEFVDESRRLQRLTTPPNAELLAREPAQRTPTLVAEEWRIETQLGWPEYVNSVMHAVRASYSCSAAATEQLACSRSLPGDRLRLLLTREPGKERLHVRIRFEAGPD